jgi:hypothetical protein
MSEKGKAKRAEYKKSERAKQLAKLRRQSPQYKGYMANYLDKYQRRDEVKLARERVRKDWNGMAHHILSGMRSSSQRKSLGPVEWTKGEILAVIKNSVCCKTGIAFRLAECSSPAHERNPFAPSPDRLDNSKGYTKDNVQWVCWMYNQLKGQAGEETVEIFLRSWIDHKRTQGMQL